MISINIPKTIAEACGVDPNKPKGYDLYRMKIKQLENEARKQSGQYGLLTMDSIELNQSNR